MVGDAGYVWFNCFYFIPVISTFDTVSCVFCDDKYTLFFKISNHVAEGLNVKNCLKINQLARQPQTLKALMQKILVLDSE